MSGSAILVVSDQSQACERLIGLLVGAGLEAHVETEPERVGEVARRIDPRVGVVQWSGGSLSALLVGRLMSYWPMPVLVLEKEDDRRSFLRALRADAFEVLPEEWPDDRLLERIRETLREGRRLHEGGRPRLGTYELGDILGRGGNGTVYAATDLALMRPVALKVLHPDHAFNAEYVARFEREAKSALRLNHPNLMKVYDLGRARGRVYIAMERVEGKPLDQILRVEGRLDPVRALRITRQIAAGLSHAHDLGLIHRDIKPSNLVVGQEGRVKLLDFGLLKPLTDEGTPITHMDEFIGTLQYAAPEHLRGERVDARGDLYSLGVVLYEALTGLRPHSGTDSSVVAKDVALGRPPVPILEIRPDLDPRLAKFIHALLDPHAAMRPPSAQDVLERIDAFLAERSGAGTAGTA